MECYRKKLKNRRILLGIVILTGVSFGIYDVFGLQALETSNVVLCFSLGLMIAITILACNKMIQYSRILQDNQKVEMEYNQENDERRKEIRSRAGAPLIQVTSFLMLLAGIIAGYFNETVFITLVAAVMGQLTLASIVKLYYMKKL